MVFGFEPLRAQCLKTGPLCPMFCTKLQEPCSFSKVPDGPLYLVSQYPHGPKRRNTDTHVWVKPRPHTLTKCGLMFPPQYHISYKWGYYPAPLYTECPRRNVPDFRRVFLMLKYTDITQNTYVQSWTVTEIKAREKCGLLAVPRTVPGSRDVIPIRCALSVLVYGWLKRVPRCDCTCKVLSNPKDNYDVSASVFVVQFNGFMSLTI